MANIGQQYRNAWQLEQWRKALPGVADDQIVIPRHLAYGRLFFLAPHGQDAPEGWQFIRWWMCQTVYSCYPPGGGRNDNSRRYLEKVIKRAERWWISMKKMTPLTLNRNLFMRRDGWKDWHDFHEFQMCYFLCLAWLNLPASKKRAVLAKRRVREIFREMRDHVEAGEIAPAIRDSPLSGQVPI